MKQKLKYIIFISILSILALFFIPNKVNAATYTDEETGITWTYTVSENNATNVFISFYTTLPETLEIPETIDGYTVTSICGSNTSMGSESTERYNILKTNKANTEVKSIVIPETINTIGVNTFANFQGLTSLVIPDKVSSISAYAFYNCSNLVEIQLPATVSLYTYTNTYTSSLERAVFYKCTKISKITITPGFTANGVTKGITPTLTSTTVEYMPWNITRTAFDLILQDGITHIGDYSFYRCSYMKSVKMPDTLEIIGMYAFHSCTRLTEVEFPENLGNIGSYAFNSCSGIKTMNLPDSLKTIGTYAFAGCTTWTSENFSLPKNLTQLGQSAFYRCLNFTGTLEFPSTFTQVPAACFGETAFTEVKLPDTVTVIGNSAFEQCLNLEKINMPTSLKTIQYEAFENCTKLTGDLKFPDTCTALGDRAFQNCTGFDGKLTIGANLGSIGKNVFFGCTGFKEAEIESGVITKVGSNMFSNCTGLEKVILGDSITVIDEFAFQACTGLKEIPTNGKIKTIGNYAFQGCTGLTTLKFSSSVETLGQYAFQDCIGITGDLTIPDTIKSIGANAFNNCTGINGTLQVGKGMDRISKFTFYGCPNVEKVIIPNTVKIVESFSFWGISDVYYLGTEDEVEFSNTAGGSNELFVHFENCTHKLNIDLPTGYEIINAENGKVLTNSEYTCGTKLKLALKSDEKDINDLSVVVLKQGKYKNSENIEEKIVLSEFKEYEISKFSRDYTILIKDTRVTTDLSLRNYIYQVNYNNLAQTRVPNAENENGIISYKHIKVPVEANTGDLIEVKVRVYNEGNETGYINEITEYLPEGIVLANSDTNRKYGWVAGENGKISTKYFENRAIASYSGTGTIPYEEISFICKVTSLGIPNANQRLVIIGEITSAVTKDSDSTYGQITSSADSTFKNAEAYGSTADSYVKCDDDDTDFENIVIKPSIPVEYSIKVTKVDSDTQALLAGAVFNLKDSEGNIVSTAATDEFGVLTFDLITSYGEGTDIFYIEEALAPEGYKLVEKETIEVNVTKTIIDEVLGTYSLNVICQTLNYSTDITRYDYNPIATPEHLAKVGSGEWIEYDGYRYQFTETANYKLVNDIDLDGIVWTPIDKKITGIFDGNNHSIKNLTIASNDLLTYSEVGLFRYFSGIVQGLNMENVNIHVPGMIDSYTNNGMELDTISGYTCVGAFAGFMEKGTVKSCSVSGKITAACNNVGGLIGHSSENNIIKFQNSTNSATIEVFRENTQISDRNNLYNVGGLIGCAIGSLSLNDCTNEGKILGNGSNVGGLVGFVNSTGYEETAIRAEYSEDDKIIGLVIENVKANGKYDIVLENRDAKTLGFIKGAKYTVYDSQLNPISGFENIELENGKLRVASVDINNAGIDTYYIKEETPAPGYVRLNNYVKLVVSREWNGEKERFDVIVNTDNILNNKIQEEPKQENTYKPLGSTTGEVFTGVTEELIGFYNDKVAIVECSNKGSLTGFLNVGGILGTAYCNVQMDLCNNTGDVSAVGFGKAGGLIAETRKQSEGDLVEIQNSTNEGNILSSGHYGSSSGIIAHAYSDIKVTNCINKGDVTAGDKTVAGGIIADLAGTATIRECTNEGKIVSFTSTEGSYDQSCLAGGIVGKQLTYQYGDVPINKEVNNLYIYDSVNSGDVKANYHLGGIVGFTTGKDLVIQNTMNKDNTLEAYNGENGGIVGYTSVNNLEIKNCVTKNTEFTQAIVRSGSYGFAGGILGTVSSYNPGNTTNNKVVNISNCEVLDCNMSTINTFAAGIFGGGYIYDKYNTGEINITDCSIERCKIESKDSNGYSNSAGILGNLYQPNTVNISNCNVKETSITSAGNYCNVGGILAMIWEAKNISLSDCNVENCNLNNITEEKSSTNTAGIAAVYSCDNTVNITNCDVTSTDLSATSGNLAGTLSYSTSKPSVLKDCDNKDVLLFSTASINTYANTGGLVAISNCEITIDNCSVTGSGNSKSIIYGRGKNVSGLVACQSNRDVINILNSEVKNVVLESETGNFSSSSYDIVSGILGYTEAYAIIKDCIIENADIGGIVGNVSGVLGSSNNSSQESVFENIVIKNSKIKNNMTRIQGGTNSTASGMTGYIRGEGKYVNCSVENSEIIGNGSSTAGFVASLNTLGTFTNCSIKDSKVTKAPGGLSTYGDYSSTGGIVGHSYAQVSMTGCLVENVEISSDNYSTGGMGGYITKIAEFKDNTINGLTIKSSSTANKSSYGSIGGYIADITSTHTTGNSFNNCDIKDFTVESASNHIGGIVGTANIALTFDGCDIDNMQAKYTNEVELPKNSYSYYQRSIGGIIATTSSGNQTISNCTVKNSNLTAMSGVNEKSNLGGLVGYGKQLSFSNCDVTNTKVINETANGMAGGILGAAESTGVFNPQSNLWTERYSVINYDDVQVKDSTISSHGAAGGVVGYGVAKITNSGVNNCTIEDKSATANAVGGIVGMSLSTKDSSIKNTSVVDSTIIGKDHAGGISGFTSGVIDNCTVSNTTITTDNAENSAGGIAGMTYDASSSITNSTVSKTNVTSANYAGGIVGYTEGNLTNNKVNEDSKITTTSETFAAGGIVGLTSNSSSEITNCDVDKVTVKAVNGYAGGIAGFANNTIEGSDVNNATIIATGAEPTKIGGILGQASSETETTTVITTSTIANTSLQTTGTAGKVAGDGLADNTGCTVDDATVLIIAPAATMNYNAAGPENVVDELVNEDKVQDDVIEENVEETVDKKEENIKEDNISTENE